MSSFPTVRENQSLDKNFLNNITRVVNNIMRGKLNNTGSFTLDASQSSTTVSNPVVGGNSVILPIPTTSNAALELGNGSLYISAKDKEGFTVAHDNNTQTDRTFDYVVFG